MELKRSDISEETRYVWECPKCQHFNEDCEDADYQDEKTCEECNESFELVD